MAHTSSLPPATTSEALSLLSADILRPMMALLPMGTQPPTRKADMVSAIERHLSGDSLRKLWAGLDETQQLAVREALDTPHAVFDRRQFQAKYGKLPVGLGTSTTRARACLLHFFLYPSHRHATQPTIVPPDLAQLLHAFVPPPPEAEVAAADDVPETVGLPESRYAPRGKKPPLVQRELTRRDMERTAQHDLLAVLRLVEGGRIAVSGTTRRPSAAASQRVAEVLAGGDFFDSTSPGAPRWVREIGPIRAFAWPCLLQAAKLTELRGSRLALTRAGRASLSAPAPEDVNASAIGR